MAYEQMVALIQSRSLELY